MRNSCTPCFLLKMSERAMKIESQISPNLHNVACINIVVVEEVADFVVTALGDGQRAVAVGHIVAVAPIVVALFVLDRSVLEILVGRCEVEWWVRVRPKLRPLPRPPHGLQHLIPVNVSQHRHLLHLQLHLDRVHPCPISLF